MLPILLFSLLFESMAKRETSEISRCGAEGFLRDYICSGVTPFFARVGLRLTCPDNLPLKWLHSTN